jgi:hypothetical protein
LGCTVRRLRLQLGRGDIEEGGARRERRWARCGGGGAVAGELVRRCYGCLLRCAAQERGRTRTGAEWREWSAWGHWVLSRPAIRRGRSAGTAHGRRWLAATRGTRGGARRARVRAREQEREAGQAWAGFWLGRENDARGPVKVKSPFLKKTKTTLYFSL